VNFHIFLHVDPLIENLVSTLQKVLSHMTTELDQLRSSVAANTTVTASAIALIQGIKAQLDAAIESDDPDALTALSDSLESSDAALAAAISANTPAAPAAANPTATPAV
jgi:hypothetical protein